MARISIVPRHVLGGQGYTSPNEILTKAVIGVGGMGQGHLKSINPTSKLLAICDVDEKHLQNSLKQVDPDVKGLQGLARGDRAQGYRHRPYPHSPALACA